MPEASKSAHSRSARFVRRRPIGGLCSLPQLRTLHCVRCLYSTSSSRLQRSRLRCFSTPLRLLRSRLPQRIRKSLRRRFRLRLHSPLRRLVSTENSAQFPTNKTNSTGTAWRAIVSPAIPAIPAIQSMLATDWRPTLPPLRLTFGSNSHPQRVGFRDSRAAQGGADRGEDAPSCRCSASAARPDCAPAIRPSNRRRRRWEAAADEKKKGCAHLSLHEVLEQSTEIRIVGTVVEAQRSTVLQIHFELVGNAFAEVGDRELRLKLRSIATSTFICMIFAYFSFLVSARRPCQGSLPLRKYSRM